MFRTSVRITREERARFDRIRVELFEELFQKLARMRLFWLQPVMAGALALFLLRSAPALRTSAQVLFLGPPFLLALFPQLISRGPQASLRSFYIFAAAFVLSILNTGGLSSPLLVGVFPVMMTGWLNPHLQGTGGRSFFRKIVALVVLATLATPAVYAQLGLAPDRFAAFQTQSYALTASLAFASSSVGVFLVCRAAVQANERFAIELAKDREELYCQNALRTRGMEGLAARLAHEVKTPLAAIRGLSSQVARSIGEGKAAERLRVVTAEAERLQAIVEGVLSFSRGLEDPQLAQVSPTEVTQSLFVLLELRAQDAQVTCSVSGNPDLFVSADPNQLKQALHHLILNAIEASPRGGRVEVEISRAESALVRIVVVDHGPGIRKEVLDRIAKPYFSTKPDGVGLGLTIARAIVQQHGGRLKIESTVGSGTSVAIELREEATLLHVKEHALPALRKSA
jgi:two-component system, NtrC family, sensor histidine kinase HydH